MTDSAGRTPEPAVPHNASDSASDRDVVTFPPSLGDIVERSSKPRSGRYSREDVRTNIAIYLILVFGAMNLAVMGILVWDEIHNYDVKPLKEVAELLFPALTALVGTVMGFYFASKEGEDLKS